MAFYLADGWHCQVAVWRNRATDGVLWLWIRRVPGLPADLFMALCYLPPDLTTAAAHTWFDTLAEECAQAMASGLVLVAGDINARTAGRSESIDDVAQPGESVDTVINSHGRALLHFCCTTGLHMCNGRVAGDCPAQPTSRGRSGQANAMVDYYLACPRLTPRALSPSVPGPATWR